MSPTMMRSQKCQSESRFLCQDTKTKCALQQAVKETYFEVNISCFHISFLPEGEVEAVSVSFLTVPN